ncbi:hypothetical protein N2S64_20740, partial [Escherichia coli]|nr:hypothetical protein [Escherichia coli]
MMMGTGSGAKQVNGEHSTRGNKKLTVAISPLAGFSAPSVPEHNRNRPLNTSDAAEDKPLLCLCR